MAQRSRLGLASLTAVAGGWQFYSDEPPIWFHEVFRRDGTPYDAEETALISRLTSAAKRAHQAKV